MKTVIVATRTFGKYSEEPVKLLEKNGFTLLRPEYLDENILKRADAIILGTGKLSGEMIRHSSIKIIARHGVGVDNVDLKTATELGIPVTITPNANTVSVAELTIALILALSRRLIDSYREISEKKFSPVTGIEIFGKTLGIIGFGAIGRETSKRAICLGMKVLACDPYVEKNIIERHSVEAVGLETLLKNSDFVSLHVPLTQSTKHMIGKEQLKMMKKSAFLINTSRGGIVDERALVEALKEGYISGAALDAFEQEPLPEDSILYDCPNLVLTPHAGAHTYEAIYKMNMMSAQAVVDFFDGKIPLHVANEKVVEKLLEMGFLRG